MVDRGDLLAEPACARLPPNLRPLLLETPGTSSGVRCLPWNSAELRGRTWMARRAKLLCGPPVSSVSGGFRRLSFLFPPPVTEVSGPRRFEVSWLSFRFWRLAVVQDLVVLASFYPC